MKCLIFAVAIFSGSIASACPPRNEEMQAEDNRRELQHYINSANQAEAIVYGVVVDGIGSTDSSRVEGYTDKVGSLRVIHDYRGLLKAGRRIKLRPGLRPFTCMGLPASAVKGMYGVVIIDKYDPQRPSEFRGFVADRFIQRFIDDGIIQSAQHTGASK